MYQYLKITKMEQKYMFKKASNIIIFVLSKLYEIDTVSYEIKKRK